MTFSAKKREYKLESRPGRSQASFEPIQGKISGLKPKKSKKIGGEILKNGFGAQLSGGDLGQDGPVLGHVLC